MPDVGEKTGVLARCGWRRLGLRRCWAIGVVDVFFSSGRGHFSRRSATGAAGLRVAATLHHDSGSGRGAMISNERVAVRICFAGISEGLVAVAQPLEGFDLRVPFCSALQGDKSGADCTARVTAIGGCA